MKFSMANKIKLVIPRRALNTVFDECDRYKADETGGRVLGTYNYNGNVLTINVNGIIEPGPNAKRTASYLQQDGAYQEQVFRKVEDREPSVEHLGNWHTHHVNGYPHLSDGDIETYRRTVEHHKHNTDFFYALLVIKKKEGKTGLQRYVFKNYVLRRGDPKVYEVPSSALTLTDGPLVWPDASDVPGHTWYPSHRGDSVLRQNRVYDRDIVSQFYPNIRPYKSEEVGIFWRGSISLIDRSNLEIVVLEDDSGKAPQYTVTLRNLAKIFARSYDVIAEKRFASCREALVTTERMYNTAIHEHLLKKSRRRWWKFLTLYVGQGALTGIRVGGEGIIVDAHMPATDCVTPEEIQQSLSIFLRDVAVRGLILTGFDADHAHLGGVEWILSTFIPDWIMYPKYFKDTDTAGSIFSAIKKHEVGRANTARPLTRHSIRLDQLNCREVHGLGKSFTIELFSPHAEDMDSSNNCSIVAKITGNNSTGFRYLVTGDTETDRWEVISRLFGVQLSADVMAAAHHGAVSGTHPKALLNVSPDSVLISAGVDNQFDHPRGAAVLAYQSVAKHVWATNAGGEGKNLLTRRDGSNFRTTRFRHAPAAT